MTTLYWILLVLRYLHILGAITLMGGTIFAYFAAVPGLEELPEADRAKAHAAIRSRWNKLVMLSTLLILVSGIANLGIYASQFDFGSTERLNGPYNTWAGIKFLLALPIFFFAALLAGRSSLAQKVQANAKSVMALNLVLALTMVLIGGALRFVDRRPKARTETAVRSPVGEEGTGNGERGTGNRE